MNTPVITIKIDNIDIQTEFEVISAVNRFRPSTKEQLEIISHLNDIDKCLLENQILIDSNNIDIDCLTNYADTIDYTIAIASGIITGLIDSFFIGEFSLDEGTKWGKEKIDKFVMDVAKKKGYNGMLNRAIQEREFTLEGAVSFLEKKYPIPADAATNLFGGGTQHHLRDFSHHPTPLGLMFSMLTQFTKKVFGTNTLGAFVIADVPNMDLIGKDLSSKYALGFTNWIFHMVSDIAGSSSSILKGKYGTGLPGPIVSLLKEISSLPFFSHKDKSNSFCLWVSKLFNGTLFMQRDLDGKPIPDSILKFDLRAELGVLQQLGKQSIPILINECIVRTAYFVRRLIMQFKVKQINSLHDFIHEINWKSTLPHNNRTITRMLTISSGTFVAVDMADAAIRSAIKSGGEPSTFFANMVLRVNFVGLGRFAVAVTTDCLMEHNRKKHYEERTKIKSQMLHLYASQVFYKQAGMWIAAKETEQSIHEMENIATTTISYYMKSIGEISCETKKIVSYREGIENKNSTLLNDISKKMKL